MRQFSIQLAQNLGTGALGEVLDVSSQRVELGAWRLEAEKELTKLSPGDLTLKLADPAGTTWEWLQTQIKSSAGLLPPFLVVDIDRERAWTGTISPAQLTRERKSREISLTSQGWSLMLASKYLGAARPENDLDPALNPWLRALPLAASARQGGDAKIVWLWWCRGSQGFSGRCYLFGAGAGWPGAPIWTAPNPDCVGFQGQTNNWLKVGDLVTCPALPGKTWKVVGLYGWDASYIGKLQAGHTEDGIGGYTVQLSPPGFTKAYCEATGADLNTIGDPDSRWQFTLTRLARETESRNYYQVAKAVGHDDQAPCYELPLDTVDGLVPGDQLHLISNTKSASWTVLQIDAASLSAITKEEVRDVNVGDRVFFTDESLAEQVFEDARAVLVRAADPYGVDLTRLQPPALSVPVLTWLPMRPLHGADLTAIRDLDAGLLDLRVYGPGSLAWEGTPENGWAEVSGAAPRVSWTDQLVAAPATLLPDETTAITPHAPRRYRATDLRWRQWTRYRTVDQREEPDPEDPWDPSQDNTEGILVYDYLLMRRLMIGTAGVTITPWNGTAWGEASTAAWPAGSCLAACILPGDPGKVVALTSSGLRVVDLTAGSVSSPVAIPDTASDGVLRTTPWGAYLVGSKGYGRISYASGDDAPTLAWITLTEVSTFYPGTFAGLDNSEVVVLGRFETLDSSGKTLTETYCLRLAAVPTDAIASVHWREKILDGAPRTLGALRDPSRTDRVVGHCGGSLFQVSRTLPTGYALERFKPSGMTAAELIEHTCQVLNAVAVPDPSGTLHIVSRASAETVINLQVYIAQTEETRAWEHRYTCVRVSGEAEDVYADVPAPGEVTTQGGQLLEVTQHPLIWTLSGCEAMARSLHAWFSPERRVWKQTWVWPDPATAAPWESLPPLARIHLNGDTSITWMVLRLEDRKTAGEAKVTLLEVS